MTQKALLVTETGSPLIESSRPIPEPKEGQIQVKLTVAGLNPHDAKAQYYGLFVQNRLPSTLAVDVVGAVSAIGPNVSKFGIGDKTDYAAKVPEGINDNEAATLALNPLTAFWALFREDGAGIPPPAPFYGRKSGYDYSRLSLVVIGGGSAIGKYAIEWAKYAGFGTIITTASKSKREKELLEHGATHVLDRHAQDEELD
ncbi:GroES-like protein [Lepidopterella palustris CBS 459.81]|uniref:GroES-like protein n=1 Tax=Lepidopterella palustris CBS 459.81 TaxID=1314670 RepID=A0A8E2DYL1_9PEZI|nr:GroES-like protein [Lepidopterella palustris CBS 459.81]